ncbi:unnamed protein product [Cuscuta epithymum]|uniref:Uncharacterized protein n=1 Tax=Cuscuta epithymum TaxID=186058 RepID=A0AAV0G8G0_9ASTE|nr:unnamed protein product [Cuscuta epithymum]
MNRAKLLFASRFVAQLTPDKAEQTSFPVISFFNDRLLPWCIPQNFRNVGKHGGDISGKAI